MLTFTSDAARARGRLAAWLASRTWFADARLARAKIVDMRGVYLPAYVYSAVARTEYSAQIGEHYTETETYEKTDAHGQTSTETRTITRTEYRPLTGSHIGYVTDVVVSASAGLDHRELAAVEPFEMLKLRRFAPALVSGWIAEEFSRTREACLRASHQEAVDDVGTRLRRFMPGDNYCDLESRTTVQWESLDPVLVPVWVFAVRYRGDKPPIRVVINGQTGAIAGVVPLATWKLVVASLIVVAAIAGVIVWLYLHHGRPQ